MLKNYNIKLLRMFILSLLTVSPYYIRILRRYKIYYDKKNYKSYSRNVAQEIVKRIEINHIAT